MPALLPESFVRVEGVGEQGAKGRETSVPFTFREYLLSVRYCEAFHLIIVRTEDGLLPSVMDEGLSQRVE